jgi:hypothetical protein
MAKLIAGIERGRAARSVTRMSDGEISVWIRQVGFSGGLQVEAYMWPDGTISLCVLDEEHRRIHEWRSDKPEVVS